jgi:hypothetical protein
MSAMVQNNPNKDISDGMFHEARYNLAHCRYQHAMSLSGAEKTEKLKLARGDIGITYRLRPSMGEKYQWKEKYEKLLQDVQKELGEEPVGLSAFDAPPAPTPASAASTTRKP